jgi:dTDP-glucose 4,6-dehydratase
MVEEICGALDQLRTAASHEPYRELITFVADRPGHDRRYAMSTGKIERELGWKPSGMFGQALRNTIQWYLDNPAWTESVRTGAYRDWVEQNYAGRLPVASGEKR